MQFRTDILVIGSGIAGLTFALKASKYSHVLIITKKDRAESNTNYAQGGIASVISQNDTFGSHIKDTLECGAGLCHPEAVKQIVNNGPSLINDLMKFGVNFSKEEGKLDLGREGGHSADRIIHSKDKTGKEIERALLHKISRNKKITLLEHHTAVELITEHHLKKGKSSNKNCYGAYVYDELKDIVITVSSLITVICTGGIGQVYLHTTNPSIATGDGIAMAYRCGCEIANMEFVQFHPTSLYEPGDGRVHAFLISEAMRGAGAKLKTIKGKEFMKRYDSRAELAPRDIVARAIDSEMKKSGSNHVYLDASHIGKSKLVRKFPNIYKKCTDIGLDISKDYIPVVPAAHYICGGIACDLNGKSNLNNLYVLGESSMTGVHGANRLASNSLLEAVVYADVASKKCKKDINKSNRKKLTEIPPWDDSGTINTDEWILVSQNRNEIRQIMSNYVGIVRSNERLKRAFNRIELIRKEIEDFYKKTRVNRDILELRNMALISYLITRSAILRKESRGLHYNTNFPYKSKKYNNDTVISISQS